MRPVMANCLRFRRQFAIDRWQASPDQWGGTARVLAGAVRTGEPVRGRSRPPRLPCRHLELLATATEMS